MEISIFPSIIDSILGRKSVGIKDKKKQKTRKTVSQHDVNNTYRTTETPETNIL